MMSLLNERADTWISRLARGAAYLGFGFAMLACANATSALPEALRGEGGAPTSQPPTGEAGEAQSTGGALEGLDFCAARELLRVKCQRCHSDPPEHGAPFPLVTYADVSTPDKNGNPRYLKMQRAIESDYMPATFVALDPPAEALSADEKSLLLDWLAGTPPRQGSCE